MTIWRIYNHKCRFRHSVPEADWLQDKACLTGHEHGFAPNPICNFTIEVATKKTIDFKLIKTITVKSLGYLCSLIIDNEQEDVDGTLITPWYYDFGCITTEELITDLRNLIIIEFKTRGHEDVEVRIKLNETRKYSVRIE